jgi:glycerol-3-phosphate acyltransferase PlsY
MFYIQYILLIIICYLIGSVPTAYVILKKRHGKDIRNEGTGNVGAMNSFDVSGSKSTGIIVFILDFLKGAIPSFVLAYIFRFPLELIVIPILAVVVGHNFSIWLKFKGGRGLATAAGIAMAINFWLLIIWCVVYFLTFLINKNVHIDSIAATIFLPVGLVLAKSIVIKFGYIADENSFDMLFTLCSLLCLLILIKHIKPTIELITNKRKTE